MSQDNFWDNRSYAQKLVAESSSIKRRIDPLFKAETQHADMRTMLELADGEDEATQKDIQSSWRPTWPGSPGVSRRSSWS